MVRDPSGRSPAWGERTPSAPAGFGPGRRAGSSPPVRPGPAAVGGSRAHEILHIVRSSTVLLILALGLGLALAALIGGAVYGIAAALHHAATQ